MVHSFEIMTEKEQCFEHRNKTYDDIVSFAYEDSWNPGIKNTYHCTPLSKLTVIRYLKESYE